MDIKKLKSFIAPGLAFGNPVRSSKPQSTLREIRVFDQTPTEPICPICGHLLEDCRNQPQPSLDELHINQLTGGEAHRLRSHPFDWRCNTCKAPVLFNKDSVTGPDQVEDKIPVNGSVISPNAIKY